MEVGLFCFFLKSKIENKIAAVNNVGDIRNWLYIYILFSLNIRIFMYIFLKIILCILFLYTLLKRYIYNHESLLYNLNYIIEWFLNIIVIIYLKRILKIIKRKEDEGQERSNTDLDY
jgi:hypothetical protein